MAKPLKTAEQKALREEGFCAAKTKRGGTVSTKTGKTVPLYCHKQAGWGTEHPGHGACRLHGGNTPNAKLAAEKSEAKAAVRTLGLSVQVDPMTALMDELHRTAGHVAWLAGQVQQLEHTAPGQDSQLYGPVGGGQGGFPEFKPHVLVGMYNEERKHLTQVAATCIKCGIAERQVRLAEQTGQLIADVINGTLEDLGLKGDKRVPAILRSRLAAIETTATDITQQEAA